MVAIVKSCSESAQKLLAKVDDVRPTIEAYSAQAESDRHLADEVYDELLDGGFFRTLVPKAFEILVGQSPEELSRPAP